MYDERALILGRLKRHEQAIAIYANILHDYRAAERYCNQHYNRADVEDSQVFLHLLKMYAQPPDNTIIGLMYAGVSKPQPNIPQAIKILKDYPHRINTSMWIYYDCIQGFISVEGINLLSGDARLCDVWMALEAILQSATSTRRNVCDNDMIVNFDRYILDGITSCITLFIISTCIIAMFTSEEYHNQHWLLE
jgi:hypothetical protein